MLVQELVFESRIAWQQRCTEAKVQKARRRIKTKGTDNVCSGLASTCQSHGDTVETKGRNWRWLKVCGLLTWRGHSLGQSHSWGERSVISLLGNNLGKELAIIGQRSEEEKEGIQGAWKADTLDPLPSWPWYFFLIEGLNKITGDIYWSCKSMRISVQEDWTNPRNWLDIRQNLTGKIKLFKNVAVWFIRSSVCAILTTTPPHPRPKKALSWGY